MKRQKSNLSNLMIELCEISLIRDQRDFKLSCLDVNSWSFILNANYPQRLQALGARDV